MVAQFVASAIAGKQFVRALGEHAANLAAFPFHSCDHHRIVRCGLVPHPGDDGSFCPLFHWDAFCSGHRAAADRRGMIGHRAGPVGWRVRRAWGGS